MSDAPTGQAPASDILRRIVAVKRDEVATGQRLRDLASMRGDAEALGGQRDFTAALRGRIDRGESAVIAEIKKASPSKGVLRKDFEPAAIARSYAAHGAAALSVLTDAPFFQGSAAFLREARAACVLPVLRKDFMVDPWQVAEARAIGADAILIIVAALDDGTMAEIEAAAIDQGMDVLVEVHHEAEMARAGRLRTRLIGVNNRDLKTFRTDLANTERLGPLAPEGALLVGESGIADHADCLRLARAGVRSVLVGESLMRQADIEAATRALLHG